MKKKDSCFRCKYIRKCYSRSEIFMLKRCRKIWPQGYNIARYHLSKCPCSGCMVRMRCDIESVFDYGHTFNIHGQPIGRECKARVKFTQYFSNFLDELKTPGNSKAVPEEFDLEL